MTDEGPGEAANDVPKAQPSPTRREGGSNERRGDGGGTERRGEGGFAPSFKEAVGRWRRRHRHPPAHETWFAVHYRVGWLVERLSYLESIHLLRQGLDVRSLAAERPARRKKGDPTDRDRDRDEGGIDVEDEPADAITHREPRSGRQNGG